jgi:hypothetical protein
MIPVGVRMISQILPNVAGVQKWGDQEWTGLVNVVQSQKRQNVSVSQLPPDMSFASEPLKPGLR